MTPYYDRDGVIIYCADMRDVCAWLRADAVITDAPFGIKDKPLGKEGLFLAPSWGILRPALDARRTGDEDIEREAWDRYVPAYLAEMRESYKRDRPQWDALLARPRIVALCYCANGRYRCHRGLLAEQILPKLGAKDGGELTAEPAQRRLFG